MRKFLALLSVVAIATAACGGTTTPSSAPSAAPRGGGEPRCSAAASRPCPKGRSGCSSTRTRHSRTSWRRSTPTSKPPIPASRSTCRSSHRTISRRSTQTRLAARDVDVVDMFAFDTGVQPYMKDVDSADLADPRRRRQPDGPDRPAVRQALRRERDPGRGHVQRQGLRDQPSAGRLQRPVHQQGSVHCEQRRRPDDMERARRRLPDVQGGEHPVHHRRWPGRLADLRDRLRHPRLRVPGPGGATSRASGPARSSSTTPPTSRCGRSSASSPRT